MTCKWTNWTIESPKKARLSSFVELIWFFFWPVIRPVLVSGLYLVNRGQNKGLYWVIRKESDKL